eukprot:1924810-Rhodomonas_salina.1
MNSVEPVRLWDKGVLLSTKWIGSEDQLKVTNNQQKEKLGKRNREELEEKLTYGEDKVDFIDDALKQLLEEGLFLKFVRDECLDNVVDMTSEEEAFLKNMIWEAILSGWNAAVEDKIGT